MSEKYIVGYDGSESARRALDFALTGAKSSGAEVLVAFVLEWSPYSFLTPNELEERHKRREEELKRARSAVIDPVLESISKSGVQVDAVIKYGNVPDTLCRLTKESGASQMFIGRTGEGGLVERVFGSVAGSLAQIAPVPCTLVP
jgi:nucleotide-binding universal stress UspA family protein